MNTTSLDQKIQILRAVTECLPEPLLSEFNASIDELRRIVKRGKASELAMQLVSLEMLRPYYEKVNEAAGNRKTVSGVLSTEHSQTRCPVCMAPIHVSVAVHSFGAPKPNDLSICAKCKSFLRFMDSLQLRELTVDEIAELPDEQRNELIRARKALGG